MIFLAAATTADDVFRGVNQNMDQSVDGRTLVALAAAVVGVVMLLYLASRRRDRKAAPSTLNHVGRLLKEIQRKIGLRPAEMRQLKAIAEQEKLDNPLVLMLCPSVLQRATQKRGLKKKKTVVMRATAGAPV